jgi:glycosyltransferase involved in cell wall biosynthesis
MEGAVLRAAAAVIAVSKGVADDLRGRHADCTGRPWHVIPNGFDPPDLEGAAADRNGVPEDRLLVTYTGTLYGPRHPGTLVSALESLDAESHPCIPSIRIRFVGRVAETIRLEVERSRVAHLFEFDGYVNHARAVALSKGSDVMLLIIDDAPQAAGILTGKLFEYLGLRKPILAIAPSGEAREVVERDLGCGWVASPGDINGMRDALIAMWREWKAGAMRSPKDAELGRFTRRNQAAALASIFDELAEDVTDELA